MGKKTIGVMRSWRTTFGGLDVRRFIAVWGRNKSEAKSYGFMMMIVYK